MKIVRKRFKGDIFYSTVYMKQACSDTETGYKITCFLRNGHFYIKTKCKNLKLPFIWITGTLIRLQMSDDDDV